MKTHVIEKETKDIVKAIIHAEKKKRYKSGRLSQFDKASAKAIAAAKAELKAKLQTEMDIGPSGELVEAIYKSLLYNTPWELAGETYICRRLFYNYRTEFCYLVAVNMKIINRSGEEGI